MSFINDSALDIGPTDTGPTDTEPTDTEPKGTGPCYIQTYGDAL